MKKLLILSLFVPFNVFCQCTYKDLLPFKNNISRFEAINISNNIDRFIPDSERNWSPGSFSNIEYLKNDSVYKDSYYLNVNSLKCFTFDSCYYTLNFCDDKLYKQTIILYFKPSSYKKCITTYETLIAIFKNAFTITRNKQNIYNSDNNVQIGECYNFSNYDFKKLYPKLNESSVGYSLVYKSFYNSSQNKTILTNEIEYYEIEIQSVDLTKVKLTAEGY